LWEGENPNVPKIVAVKSAEDALKALKNFKPILALTGPYSTENLNLNVPYIDVLKNQEKIVGVVEGIVRKIAIFRNRFGNGQKSAI